MKKLYVHKSKINGKGLYTAEPISKGEHIAFIQGTYRRKRSKNSQDALTIPNWYGITESLWIDPGNNVWAFFNHSCQPNTAIVGTKKVIALKKIPADTEITIDYSMTDGDLNWELDRTCGCGSAQCRKKIHSIQRIPEKAFQRHMPFIPKYFIRLRKAYLQSAKL